MKTFVPIGYFSRLTGLPPATLRYYDEIGLLCPARTDQATGYRYYRRDQTFVAERIRLLRSLDVPIREIREILAQASSEAYLELLSRQRERLEERIALQQRALGTLERLQTHGELPYGVALKKIPQQWVLFTCAEVSYASIDRARLKAFAAALKWVRSQGVRKVGPACTRSLSANDELTRPNFDVITDSDSRTFRELLEMGVVVPHELAAPSGFMCDTWPANEVAFVEHTGPYESLHFAGQLIRNWVFDKCYSFAGPVREVFHVGPRDTRDANLFRTEVQYPVARPGNLASKQ